MLRFFVFLTLALCVAARKYKKVPYDAECSIYHPLVGKHFELSSIKHGVSGTVVITSDCSFEIRHFTYDGEGPDVYVYGFSQEFIYKVEVPEGTSPIEVPEGTIETEFLYFPKGEGYTGETLYFKLPHGVTWDKIKVISIWCEEFGVDFGSTVLY